MRDGLDPNKNEAYEEEKLDKYQYEDDVPYEWDAEDIDEYGCDYDYGLDEKAEEQKSLFDFTLYKTEVRNVFKNIKLFFKRVFMGNKRYLDLLDKENSLSQVKSGVTISTEAEDVDAKSPSGFVVMRFRKAVHATIHVDLTKMLRGIGVTVNDGVKWDVIGVPDNFSNE
jgi:hypothetical protein